MSNNFDSLGDRMKAYEDIQRHKLIRRMPVIIRLDGRAFHSLTKFMERPFDSNFHTCMRNTVDLLFKEVQCCVLAYSQSDEISLLLRDWDTFTTEQWFDGNVQKIVSISASIATWAFTRAYQMKFSVQAQYHDHMINFDARVFNLPKEEVCNYFIWRQQDAIRNSVSMLAQSYYSSKQLHGVKKTEMLSMLREHHNVHWEDLDSWKKQGFGAGVYDGIRWFGDVPIFSEERNSINKLVEVVPNGA